MARGCARRRSHSVAWSAWTRMGRVISSEGFQASAVGLAPDASLCLDLSGSNSGSRIIQKPRLRSQTPAKQADHPAPIAQTLCACAACCRGFARLPQLSTHHFSSCARKKRAHYLWAFQINRVSHVGGVYRRGSVVC